MESVLGEQRSQDCEFSLPSSQKHLLAVMDLVMFLTYVFKTFVRVGARKKKDVCT